MVIKIFKILFSLVLLQYLQKEWQTGPSHGIWDNKVPQSALKRSCVAGVRQGRMFAHREVAICISRGILPCYLQGQLLLGVTLEVWLPPVTVVTFCFPKIC